MDKTVAKALNLLENLVKSPEPLGVTDLAQRLDLTKSNVHRTLDTLRQLGYVEYLPEQRKYRASFKLWQLGTWISENLDIKQVASPHLQALAEATGETVHLCLLSGDSVVYIDKVDCKHHVRPATRIGGSAPAHCVSTGKAILAFREAAAKAVIGKLEKHTPQTIVSKAAFEAELAAIREKGIAYNRGEWHVETIGAAAPIRNAEGVVMAAVGVSIPTSRAKMPDVKKLAPTIRATAYAISAALGFHGKQ
ncbi:IclR family transcriptional regulator [Pusillimonas caeni]|uniref:IclR family transcriptional regulator n=1 Tax=Pusillimonas caeni TaxID=1348472 RepID=UPI000E59F14F|nr:IclR family transcriptional regulator [Pusillimonas caeni]TFL15798.1 IclR family transcriptional regulator [Pusillimonas caeni]